MTSLGGTGSPVPRAKPGDFERALALLAGITGKETKARLTELRDGAAGFDKSAQAARAAAVSSSDRETAAQAAEVKATRARQALADKSAEAQAAHATRERAVADREAAVDARDDAQERTPGITVLCHWMFLELTLPYYELPLSGTTRRAA